MQTTVTFCEQDLAEHQEEVRGERIRLTVDGIEYELDICPAHDSELIEPLRAVLAAYGKRIGGKRAAVKAVAAATVASTKPAAKGRTTNGIFPCEHPGCTEGPFTHATSRAAHYRKDHPGWTPDRSTKPKRSGGKATTSKRAAKATAKRTPRKRAARKSTEAAAAS